MFNSHKNMLSPRTHVFVIPATEELLEQFREQLHEESEPTGQSLTFSSVSPSSVHLCIPSSTTVLLLGRTVNEDAKNLISNILRLRLTWNTTDLLIIAKHELTAPDKEAIERFVEKARREWSETWGEELARLRKLRPCKTLEDRIQTVRKWAKRAELPVDLAIVEEGDIKNELTMHLHIGGPFRLSPVLGPSLSLKPPALHWANWPHESELQVSLRAELPENCVTEEFFRKITEKVKNTFTWDYVYDWVSGVFVKQNEVKIVVSEVRKSVVEMAARVDIDELEEDHERAMRTLWPLFAPVVASFAQNALEIPHTMYLVLVGAPFFNKEVSHSARAFEITELLCALNIARNVVFRVEDESVRLQVDNVFPDRRPKTAADIWTNDVRIEIIATPTSPQETNNFAIEENRTASSESPMFLSAFKSKQKGRRVSFGAIRLLPAFGDEPGPSNALHVEHPILEDHSVVSDYVDRLLNGIMEETITPR
ncbi:hypothetical protein QR680_002246 [Steinernema hermaphroditum]|uniref:Uncharacterized protein n=1 Tax=Steinernema hermaphroditum TaxID=289476 RepID=A0AA39LHD1_9BILA|nr:hypothetical protein QR680_002246 [Steinernema hermaphroditum]